MSAMTTAHARSLAVAAYAIIAILAAAPAVYAIRICLRIASAL